MVKQANAASDFHGVEKGSHNWQDIVSFLARDIECGNGF